MLISRLVFTLKERKTIMNSEPSPSLSVFIFKNEQEAYSIIKNYPNIFVEYMRKTKNGFNVAIRQYEESKKELEEIRQDILKLKNKAEKKTHSISYKIKLFFKKRL